MSNASLRRRLRRLESNHQVTKTLAEKEDASELENFILSESCRCLSTDELRRMQTVIPAITQRNQLSLEEQAAFAAFGAAAEEACRHAGFPSFAEFYRRCKRK